MEVEFLIYIIPFIILGSFLGIFSGIAPGIHVNTLCAILIQLHPWVAGFINEMKWIPDNEITPVLISSMIISAAVVHSFLDIIPSIFFGAPGDPDCLSVLPGHRLLLSGKGIEALYCAAKGGLIGTFLAILLAYPLYLLMGEPLKVYEHFKPIIPFFLISVIALLVLSEKDEKGSSAIIDVRSGSIDYNPCTIYINKVIPSDNSDVLVSGRILKKNLRSYMLHTPFGYWEIIPTRGINEGFATLKGRWKFKRHYAKKKLIAFILFLSSGILGYVVMNGNLPTYPLFPYGGMDLLFPLLSGLFGVPSLILSLGRSTIPQQDYICRKEEVSYGSATKGAVIGIIVGWIPGITPTTGAVLANLVRRKKRNDVLLSSREFITMVSALGTSATLFNLVALFSIGKGRSGVMLAIEEILQFDSSPLPAINSFQIFLLLLFSGFVSSAIGFVSTLIFGKLITRKFEKIDLDKTNKLILILIVLLVVLLTGLNGALVLATATCLGLLAPLLNIRRVQLTGCLLLPITIFFVDMSI